MAKNGQVQEGRKVGRSSVTPIKLFSVDFFDLKFMSFKFGKDIFITYEMPTLSFQMIFCKTTISFLFRPSVIRGPWPRADFLDLAKLKFCRHI